MKKECKGDRQGGENEFDRNKKKEKKERGERGGRRSDTKEKIEEKG
jgi:hypothetical protein